MQIFVTSPSARESASRLASNVARRNKMIVESQQILACVVRAAEGPVQLKKKEGVPYSCHKSRLNHPVVKWACKDLRHACWLNHHLCYLYMEYARGGGEAFTNVLENVCMLDSWFCNELSEIVWLNCETGEGIEFLNFAKNDAKGLDFTNEPNVFRAYDLFLKAQGC